ncbi:alpha-L-rhamnosidase-related protein [Roseateles koreensis]|uniref:Alpha-L-rhamnosidase n=1 Tax=Roseateles koreensis TaxID=2987526 RepID=A0ABT5KP49_9BURK|nr:hypothetical protein [Roseateles koreensis]MDC8784674.1 hypothetical protein [Roseateles koreensis]
MSEKLTPEQIAAHEAAEQARRVYLPPGPPVESYLRQAQALVPELRSYPQAPIAIVEPRPNPAAPLRFDMSPSGDVAMLASRCWRTGESFTVDFGGHRAGFLSFRLVPAGGMPDSPVRLRLTFGEVPTDVAEPLHPYRGWLSEAWLQEEIVTIDDLPQTVQLPRRYAFRYVKVEVIAASSRFGVSFAEVTAHEVTSAIGVPERLPEGLPDWCDRVDAVAQATLRSCLQTCFEDGPRRDRRLWVGDLRLQALASYETYRANDVVKRCLYLFAGLTRSDGLVNGCVYERPVPTYADTVTFDYAALYNVTLQEYVLATGDLATGQDLWPVAKRQLELLCAAVGDDGLFVDTGATWCFIDWSRSLERSTAIQGVLIFALRRSWMLATMLGRAAEVAHYPDQIARLVAAARAHLLDPASGLFLSGPARQLSCASQAWMVLAGVPESADQARVALRQVMASPDAVKPVTPYLYHYIVEAMVACGMNDEALELIRQYWGGMVEAGADTFWEVYDPEEPLSSPYGDIHINSYCHAWSCTPTYFIRSMLRDGHLKV